MLIKFYYQTLFQICPNSDKARSDGQVNLTELWIKHQGLDHYNKLPAFSLSCAN